MNESNRIGIGYDIHRLAPGRKLIIGGVEIPFEMGLVGHSDSDVLAHAICDALLGAAALGDIGVHFPDTDPRFAGISSLELLDRVNVLLGERGFFVTNLDAVVIAERPRLAPYVQRMRENLATVLRIETGRVSIKAKTAEGIGAIGNHEAIAAHAVALISASEGEPA